jgi:hypothetical protein
VSKASVNQVIQRAVSDAAFRRQLQHDPGAALKGFDLSAEERSAITSGDPGRLTGLGVDQRMSKGFAIGALSGSASAVMASDAGAAYNAALIDENVAAGNKSVIELDAGHASGGSVIAGDPGSASVTAFDPTTASGDLNTVDAGVTGGVASAREGMSTAGDLNTIDEGYLTPVSSARTDPSTAGDLNTVDAGAVTAFEPGSSSAGDLNSLDAGIVSNETVNASGGTEGAGLDSGGDIRPTEH